MADSSSRSNSASGGKSAQSKNQLKNIEKQQQSNDCEPTCQHLVDFYGREFLVTPDVLMPRPETEQVIDLVLSLAGKAYLPGMLPPTRKLPKHPVILDVGTGSGCIAATLALEIPHATIFASDISKPALKVAKQNIDALSAPVSLFVSSLLDNFIFTKNARPSQNFKSNEKSIEISTPDLIVANLPYVDRSWSWVDEAALSSEPDLALYAEDGGLALIKQLIEQCRDRQIPRLVLEADPSQHARIATFAEAHNYHLDRTMGFALSLLRK